MPKRFSRKIAYDYPSTNYPRNAENYNRLEKGIDDIDNAIEEHQAQIDQLVLHGDSSPAAAQAAVGADGTVHGSLKTRLDIEYNKHSSELAATAKQTSLDATNLEVSKKINRDEIGVETFPITVANWTYLYANLPTASADNKSGWLYCTDGDGTHGAGKYYSNGTSWYFGGTGDQGYNVLRNDLVLLKDGNYYNRKVSSENDWEVGGINSSGVNNNTDTTKIRTIGYIDLSNTTSFKIESSKQYWVFWYKSNKVFLNREASWDTGTNIYTPALDAKYCRILVDTATTSDYSQLDISCLEQDLITVNDINSLTDEGRVLARHVDSPDGWVQGGIDSYGMETTSTSIIRTDFVDLSKSTYLDMYAPVNYWVFYYSEKKTYLGREGTNWASGKNTYQLTSDKKYCRILMNTGNVAYGASAYVYSDEIQLVKSDHLDSNYATKNLVSDEVSNVGYNVVNYTLNSDTLVVGNLDSGGTYTSSGTYLVTKWIPVNKAKTIHIDACGYEYWPFWYNASGVFLNRAANWASQVADISIPANASYCRILIKFTFGIVNFSKMLSTVYITHSALKANKRLLFDTDMDMDCDDAVALRCFTWAIRHNVIESLGCVTSINGSIIVGETTYYVSSYIDAMLKFDGIYDEQIAICGTRTHGGPVFMPNVIDSYYHTYTNNAGLPTSLAYYRAALASLPDGEKTDIVIVGYLNNLAGLINSPADAYVNKTGLELITEKVGTIYIMGGDYPASTTSAEGNFSVGAGAIADTNTVLTANITNKIIFLGRESGWPVQSGGILITENKTYDPLWISLRDYWASQSKSIQVRSSYDPLTTLIACLGEDKSGFQIIQGTNSINTDSASPTYGYNTFTENSTGHHYYVRYRYPTNFYVDMIDSIIIKRAWK